VDGFYQPMLRFLENMSAEGFLAEDFRRMLIVATEVTEALDRFAGYRPPGTKWS
jgi:predicted Rossmann-fold nucleotide-binding protein